MSIFKGFLGFLLLGAVLTAAPGRAATFGDIQVRERISIDRPGSGFVRPGTLAADDDVHLYAFDLLTGAMPVYATLFTASYGGAWGGPAGFDPMLSLFDGAGGLIASDDNGATHNFREPGTPLRDAQIKRVLSAGSYFLALSQHGNTSLGSLAAGFSQSGSPYYTAALGCSAGQFCDDLGNSMTGGYYLQLDLDVAPIPLPPSLALLLAGMAGMAAFRLRQRVGQA